MHVCHSCDGTGKDSIRGSWVEVKTGEKPPKDGYPYWSDDTDGTGTYWHWWDYSVVNSCYGCKGTGNCNGDIVTICEVEAAIKYGE